MNQGLHDELQRLRSDNDLDEILKVDVNAPIPAELNPGKA